MLKYSIGTITVDKDLNLVCINEGYSEHVLEGKDNCFLDNVKPEDQHLIYEIIDSLVEREPSSICFRLMGKDNQYTWVIALCNKISTENGFNIQISMQDITDLEEKINDNSLDFGTGLLDKKAIIDYAKEICNDSSKVMNLSILDIDNFKYINDNEGHSYGDEVLKEVGDVLRKYIGDSGKAGRIGGDEMMLVIEGPEDNSALRAYLKPIRENIENICRDKDGYPKITVSVGSARFPTDVDNYDDLFNLADRMLYRAKTKGKNRYVMYNPDIHGKIVNGKLAEEDKTVKDAAKVEKTRLVLETVEGFFGKNKTAIGEQLAKIIATYELDYVYIFYKDVAKSYAGFKRLELTEKAEKNGVRRIVDVTTDISFVQENGFEELFDSNGAFVIDSPDKQLGSFAKASEYFKNTGIQHAFLYKMQDMDNSEGYVFFFKTHELSRKFSLPDITDFTYLSKLIETALKTS